MKVEAEVRPEIRDRALLAQIPAVELLLREETARSAWPEASKNEAFLRDIHSRSLLRDRLGAVLERLPRPDIELEDAVADGLVDETAAVDLYTSLGELLADGSEYQRLALYLPFEFLPSGEAFAGSSRLQEAADAFRDRYLSAWGNLLRAHDVRANFVDGDVLEVDKRTGEIPRVVKAAHLIPKLIEKAMVSVEDVMYLFEHNSDETLLRSLADVIPILADARRFGSWEFARLAELKRDFIDAKIIEARSPSSPRIEKRENVATISAKRQAWLDGEVRRRDTFAKSEMIRDEILAGGEPIPDASMRASAERVDGVRLAIEKLAQTDSTKAKALFAQVRPWLVDHLATTDDTRDVVVKLFRRLHAYGVVVDDDLRELKIEIPALAGPFSKNVERMKGEFGEMNALVERMKHDAFLAERVYPAMLVFGSRLKGYGSDASDLDLAVLVKPGVAVDEKAQLREHLRVALRHDAVHGDTVEFWLDDDGDRLCVHDFDAYDAAIGESTWTHVLFGAAWAGDAKTINALRTKLLAPYFADHDARHRRRYIEEMQRDVLQYRLMHKGYERVFPPFGGITSPHASSIDGESAFWDSGYRQAATKLFVSNVFLPKVD